LSVVFTNDTSVLMTQIQIRVLRRQLAATLASVERGERVVVLKRNRAIAQIIPVGSRDPVDRKLDLLAAEGCVINKSVFQRQGRHGPAFLEQEAHWREYVTRCKSFSDVEPYGAFVEGRLCAFTLIVRVDEYAYTFHPHAEASSLKFRPMNALIFWVTQSLLRRADIKYVSYGLESLVQQADLVKFKLGMGFKAISIGRMVMLNPLARPFFSAPAAALVRKGAPRNGANNLIQDYLVFVDNYRRYVL